MKVLVDANPIVRRRTGVGYYATNLIKAAAELNAQNTFLLTAFVFAMRKHDEPIRARNVQYRLIRFLPGKFINLLLNFGIAPPIDFLAMIRTDIAFYPNFIYYPRLFTKRAVTVIYDLGYLEYPQYMENKRFTRYLERMVPRAIKKSDHLVTISENTKQGLMKHYGLKSDTITVINPAVDHQVYYPEDTEKIAKIKDRYKIKQEYFLYLGTLEPRKNIEGLLSSYLGLPANLKRQYKLVLAGSKGWKYQKIDRLIKQIGDDVIEIGYVDENHKRALYSGAKIFLYPSHYEGWGMQITEAMACGTPVVTFTNSSLPEAGGNAAKYINSAAEIQGAILEIINNPKEHKDLVNRGLAHAQSFTWQKSARQLLDLFETLIATIEVG